MLTTIETYWPVICNIIQSGHSCVPHWTMFCKRLLTYPSSQNPLGKLQRMRLTWWTSAMPQNKNQAKSNIQYNFPAPFLYKLSRGPSLSSEGAERNLTSVLKWCHLSQCQLELQTTSFKMEKLSRLIWTKRSYQNSWAAPHFCSSRLYYPLLA